MNDTSTTTVTLLDGGGVIMPIRATCSSASRIRMVILGPDGQKLPPETRDRVRAAITNSGLAIPTGAITLSFPPAYPTPTTAADLAIAAAILALQGTLDPDRLTDVVLLGELGLDGAVRDTHAVQRAVVAVVRAGIGTVGVPAANAEEAQRVPGVRVIAVESLRQLVRWADLGARSATRRYSAASPSTDCWSANGHP